MASLLQHPVSVYFHQRQHTDDHGLPQPMMVSLQVQGLSCHSSVPVAETYRSPCHQAGPTFEKAFDGGAAAASPGVLYLFDHPPTLFVHFYTISH